MTVFEEFNKFWKGSGNHNWGQNAAGDDIVPGWYFAIIILAFLGAFIGAIILGAFVNGSKWINKKNYRVEGKEFTRSTTQQLVYKLTIPVLAIAILFTGYVGSIDGTLNIYKKVNDWAAFIPFFRSQGSLLYQCNIASIFILPWLMFFNKYKAIAMIAPFTFLGASSTVFSQTDLADGKWFDGFEVHRKAIEHICLMTVPLYVMVANRFQYTTKSLVGALLYMIVFNAIVAFGVYFGWNSHFNETIAGPNNTQVPNPDFGKEVSAGEFFKAAGMLGYDNKYIAGHFWIVVVFILGPVTFLLSTILWIAYNFVYYASTNKVDSKKIKNVKVKVMILPSRSIKIGSKTFTQKAINFGLIASSIIRFAQVLGLKFVLGPVQFVKQFKQVEKQAWTKWLKIKTEPAIK